MKYILFILLSFSLLWTGACGNDRSYPGEGVSTGQVEGDPSANSDANPPPFGSIEDLRNAEITIIIRSLLGEAVFDDVSLNGIKNTANTGAKGANVGFDAEVETIDRNMNISGDEGDAVICADGVVETIQSDNATAPVYYFSPLALSATLQSFTINDPEIGKLVFNGSLSCQFKGRLEEGIETLIGSGRCASGSIEKPAVITFIYNGREHTISYNVTFKVHGAPFDLESYLFSGIFVIDGVEVNLSNYLY